jgi:hypothetical protein
MVRCSRSWDHRQLPLFRPETTLSGARQGPAPLFGWFAVQN